MTPPIYLTTPIFYVNDMPHLGHCYTLVAGDILTRFWRMTGRDVWFLTGTDEHGTKVAQAAAIHHQTPQAYADEVSQRFRHMVTYLNTTPNDFIRTTEARHYQAASALWEELEQKGQIYLGSYSGWYAVRDEAFYPESELVDGKAPTGAPVEWIEEPCYFFRLSHWEKPLLRYYADHPETIAPSSRLNETIRFIEGGLNDLAISRSKVSWGVPVPGSPHHVMYVWIDALANYISALGYPNRAAKSFQTFWPHACHLLGKDILRFHSVYWPAFLMAAGLPLPKRLYVHGWWTHDKAKMSKSLGNVIDPQALVTTYGVDAVRYFLFREMPFGQDGDFSAAALIRRLNEELADAFGNLAQRVLSFIHKYMDRKIPADVEGTSLFYWGRQQLQPLSALMEEQNIYRYLEEVLKAVYEGNRYMAQLAPWELCQGSAEDKAKMNSGLFVLTHLLKDIALFLAPIIPQTAETLLQQLNALKTPLSFDQLQAPLDTQQVLPVPTPLFRKVLL